MTVYLNHQLSKTLQFKIKTVRYSILVSLCMLLAIMTNSYAAKSSRNAAHAPHQSSLFPRGCEASGFEFIDNYLILNRTGDQAFFLIQNKSHYSIEMQRVETRNVFMSPPLVAKLNPENWAAFASDVQDFHFRCYTTNTNENGEPLPIDCKIILDVCQYPRVRFALSNMGNYWVSTNKPQQQVINDAVAKGIYLKW